MTRIKNKTNCVNYLLWVRMSVFLLWLARVIWDFENVVNLTLSRLTYIVLHKNNLISESLCQVHVVSSWTITCYICYEAVTSDLHLPYNVSPQGQWVIFLGNHWHRYYWALRWSHSNLLFHKSKDDPESKMIKNNFYIKYCSIKTDFITKFFCLRLTFLA